MTILLCDIRELFNIKLCPMRLCGTLCGKTCFDRRSCRKGFTVINSLSLVSIGANIWSFERRSGVLAGLPFLAEVLDALESEGWNLQE